MAQILLLVAGGEAGDHEVAGGDDPVAPLNVIISRKGSQGDHCPVVLHSVDVVHHRRGGGEQSGGLGSGVEPGGPDKELPGYTGDLLHPFRGVLRRQMGKFLKAVDVVLHELLVIELFLDDDVGHTQSQSTVSARFELQVDGRLLSEGGLAGVHYDKGLALLQLLIEGTVVVHVGEEGIAAPNHHHLGVDNVGGGNAAEYQPPGHLVGLLAAAALGDVVGASEAGGQALQGRPVPLGKAGHKGHRFRTEVRPVPLELFANDSVGFLPADGLKLPFAFLAHPFQRVEDPLRVVDILPDACAPGAELALGVGVVHRALRSDDAAILHIGVDAAVGVGIADAAAGFMDGDLPILRGGRFSLQGGLFRIRHRCSLRS